MTPGQNQQQPLDINRLQDVAVNVVYNVCGIITMPMEMALRPHYGSRYFPPMMMLFSIFMMLLLPVLDGFIDDPKTALSRRSVGIPAQTASVLKEWMALVDRKPEAWVFASENPLKPLWRDNVWYRHMKPSLKTVGLEWANFQVLRRTHASLGHDIHVDPKVAADQRGHGIGVALDVYTQSSIEARRAAATMLANAILSEPEIRGQKSEVSHGDSQTEGENRSAAA